MAESSNVPDHMTVVDGVRVRKDDEKRFRAAHKAVLAPQSSATVPEPAEVRKAAVKKTAAKAAGRSDDA